MLESYFEEIQRKKRINRVFWFFVLIFSIGIYFFFKGYYVSFNVNWKNIFSETGSILKDTGSEIASIHQFGIIHIKAIPKNATLTLNGTNYGNGEKLMTNYGDYTIDITRNGYIPGKMSFVISEKNNFYIDDVVLMKKPQYKKLPNLHDNRIVTINDNVWIGYSQSGMILFEDTFQTGTLINTGVVLKNIGNGKFLSGNTITEYSPLEKQWITKNTRDIQKFLLNCSNPLYQNQLLTCPENKTVLSNAGNIFTGVILQGKNFLKFDKNVIVGDIVNGNGKIFSLTGATASGTVFAEIQNEWYTNSGGFLLPLDSKNHNFFSLDFSKIDFYQKLSDYYVFIGENKNGKQLALFDDSHNTKIRYISLPDISLEDVRLYQKNGKIFIKTNDSLLFFYRESDMIHWLINGKILAFGENFSLYQVDATIWIADWKIKQ